MAFPYYDYLHAQAATIKDVTDAAINGLMLEVRKLPPEQLGLIYALICHHARLTGAVADPKTRLFYGAMTFPGGKGISVTFSNLPILLQQILIVHIGSQSGEASEMKAKPESRIGH